MGRTDSATRAVDATPAQVYAALVDEQALATWLPPAGMTGRFERFDLRPGGSFRLVLTYDDASSGPGKAGGGSDVVEARFLEVVPDVRVRYAVDFESDDPVFAGTMTMTWEVVAEGGGSRVAVRADDVPAGISPADHAAGMASSLANLEAYLDRSS
jgi:uncharacterized protein YndB with AHSA1/START domain